MKSNKPHSRRLRLVLLFAALVNFFLWGLQGLVASQWVAERWGVTLPEERQYVRLIGAFAITMAFLYYRASKDPDNNRFFLKIAILQNAIMTVILVVTVIKLGAAVYLTAPPFLVGFWGLNLILCSFFTISIYVLFPDNRESMAHV